MRHTLFSHPLQRHSKRLLTWSVLCLAWALLGPHAHAAYAINADGTVTDTATHLVWDRCALGRSSGGAVCGTGTAQIFTWPQALAEVQARNAANYLGHRDWRLPNATELLSLVDTTAEAGTSAIDATTFPRMPWYGDTGSDGRHWTSTTLASDSKFGWTVGFNVGYLALSNKTGYQGFVRLVRAGAFDSLGDAAPPVTTAGPSLSGAPTDTLAYVSVTLNEASTGYWLLVPSNAAAPTSAQVMAGNHYGSVTLAAAGSWPFTAGAPGMFGVYGLSASTSYTLYFAAIDDSFNLQPVPSSLTFTTATPVNGACGSAHQSAFPSTVPPTASLCSAGDASSVAASDSAYSWYCAGTNGGADSGMCSTSRGYIVTPSAGPHGSISPSTPQVVAFSNTASFALLPDSGYGASPTGCGGSLSGNIYTTSAIGADCAVTASFTLNTYPINTAASPVAGGTASCAPSPVDHGSTATCTAAPNAGYTFSAWSGDCSGTGACSLGNVTSARSVTAQFTLNTYAITPAASPVAGGTVSCTPNPVAHGSTATCTATPHANYTFGSWSGDCSGTGTCNLSNVTSAKAVTAQFTLNTYAITSTASPVAGGSVSCTPNPVDHGSTATCTATPGAGYTFGNWSGDCSGAGACSLGNVTSAQAVTAEFTAVVNGACGSAAGNATAFTPSSANLCAPSGGTASAVTAGSSAWCWSCSSSNGGTTATCSAPFAPIPGSGGVVGAIQASTANHWAVNTATSGFISLPAPAPAGVRLSSGAAQVRLTGGTAGSQATVVLSFSSIPAEAQLYKYGKKAASDTRSQWFVYPATIDRNAGTVTYVLTDGQKGDNDWQVNGEIDDPVGLGVGAGITAVPTLSQWALVLLAGLLGLAAFGGIVARRGSAHQKP